ncbi:Non-reducing end beta-L-arabinofuranosidase [Posidoniimonas polymericola]|uniref:Non-reducing end beta-L-arabinofuranosidase n=1 Tax=Posidoniimonas polymericola TaxID=2528002 RepID=A0A5C5YLM5_9BACT|nr:beta-L-arabinofuranosidase domain-containing protein [Posidoniimonas polymericola]TWT75709.1 Non-reducing end beta-L-arabinofuranosidase [Posidoniimonas polymericola]
MKTARFQIALGVAVALLVVMPSPAAKAQVQSVSDAPNLALVAEPSASYTSGDTKVTALNDGALPGRSADLRHGSYGNWNRTGTQWVQYEWPKAISTDKIAVYWWADGQGVHPPKASRLLYWDGGEFAPVPGAQRVGVEKDRFNRVGFDPIETTKLRLEIDSDDAGNSTGVLEWRVLDSGDSPQFPPMVQGDVDRIVMLGGKTYLSAKVKTLGHDVPKVHWTKVSGPGEVDFADPDAAETTATFSEVGEYVLKLVAGEGELTDSAEVNVGVENPPPSTPLGVVYTKRYKIDSPLWNARAKAIICDWIPHCVERIDRPDLPEGGINNFEEAAKKLAGQPAERHQGYVFANAWVHQTVESICIALMVDPQGDEELAATQEELKATLEDWIPKILAAQEPDGYLQTAFTLNDQMNRWTPENRTGHEGYTAGYFIESAINHYTLTNGTDRRLYDAAKKLADCWVANVGPEEGKQPWYDEHQQMEQGLVRFGRFVNDMEGDGAGDDYIALAKFLLDCRGGGEHGAEYDQSHVPVQQQYEAVGHAVRAVYSYSGMADVATETGDLEYRSAVMSLWDNIVNKKYYVTGGLGSGETSEGFGPNYSLRNNSYCESCSSCGQIFFQYKMNLSYHDAKYVDLYEETFYNALLGSLDLAAENFYYTNALSSGSPRYPWHACPCCVGNIPRTLLMLPTWTYVKDDEGVYVNLFIGSTILVENVGGMDVEMVQETDYPWSGDVKITVNPAEEREFAVRVRSPQRSVSTLYSSTPEADGIASVAVNGEPVDAEVEGGYLVIRREWKKGDTIALELPMTPQRVKCVDLVEANRGRVALRYGPLVYNIEAVDGNDLDGVLPPEAELTTEWRPDLLGGVLVIKGEFADGSPLVAIPNYARNNRYPEGVRGRRGPSSIVWIRDR